MRRMLAGLALGLTLSTSACHDRTASSAASKATAIAWREGDVDDALAEAKESTKPIILYWGAKWCPPCNQLKSTLFKDASFIAETANFVPVYLDGDSPGAQRWGERFGISGYPTVIILRANGSEITRLSSSVTADKFAQTLKVAAGRTTPVEQVFAAAEKNPASLSPDDWRLLGDFDWLNDPRHFADRKHTAALLDRLAAAAPDAALINRFALLSLVVGSDKGPDGKTSLTPAQQTQLTATLPAILANPAEVTADRVELSYAGGALVAALPDASKRDMLGKSLIAALDRVAADTSLPIPDRLGTVEADIALGKAEGTTLSPTALKKVQARAAWADQTAKDPMVRQSVISNAADLLHDAGDDAGAKRLLQAELTRSQWPYYYMLDLATIAEAEKDSKAAINWAKKAYETSQGPATRVQWAIEYSKTVLRQAPDDKAAIESSADAVITELAKNPGSYFQRTRAKVGAWGGLLRAWSGKHDGAAVLASLEKKMEPVCASQGQEQAVCRGWLATTT